MDNAQTSKPRAIQVAQSLGYVSVLVFFADKVYGFYYKTASGAKFTGFFSQFTPEALFQVAAWVNVALLSPPIASIAYHIPNTCKKASRYCRLYLPRECQSQPAVLTTKMAFNLYDTISLTSYAYAFIHAAKIAGYHDQIALWSVYASFIALGSLSMNTDALLRTTKASCQGRCSSSSDESRLTHHLLQRLLALEAKLPNPLMVTELGLWQFSPKSRASTICKSIDPADSPLTVLKQLSKEIDNKEAPLVTRYQRLFYINVINRIKHPIAIIGAIGYGIALRPLMLGPPWFQYTFGMPALIRLIYFSLQVFCQLFDVRGIKTSQSDWFSVETALCVCDWIVQLSLRLATATLTFFSIAAIVQNTQAAHDSPLMATIAIISVCALNFIGIQNFLRTPSSIINTVSEHYYQQQQLNRASAVGIVKQRQQILQLMKEVVLESTTTFPDKLMLAKAIQAKLPSDDEQNLESMEAHIFPQGEKLPSRSLSADALKISLKAYAKRRKQFFVGQQSTPNRPNYGSVINTNNNKSREEEGKKTKQTILG